MGLPQVGEIFASRYRIEGTLGVGGFGTVFEATDTAHGLRVALKVLKTGEDGYDAATAARFTREVELLAKVEHPNVVKQFSHGRSEDGVLYVTHELLGGRDLGEVLVERQRLAPETVIATMRQILSALDAVHRLGIVHRDLKPDNVRVISEDAGLLVVKLLDFGIARTPDDGHPAVTQAGELIGTPRYMSPEQLSGRTVGPTSDLFSLGLMSFELLAGASVLPGNSIFEQITRLGTGHLLSTPEIERMNPGLLAVLQRMTAKSPGQRYQTASEVFRALDVLQGRNTQPRSAEIQQRQQTSDKSGHRAPIGLGILVIAAAVAVGLSLMLRQDPQPEPVSPPRRAALAHVLGTPAGEETRPTEVSPPPKAKALPDYASAGCGATPRFSGEATTEGLLYYVPKSYQARTPVPLVILLKDKWDPARQLLHAGFAELSEQEGFVVMAPIDVAMVDAKPERLKLDVDAAFFDLCIDRRRVYVVSQGKGGRLGGVAACAPWVTAHASNSMPLGPPGPSPTRQAFICPDPKPRMVLRPAKSGEVPLQGGLPCDGRGQMVASRAELDTFFKDRNGCTGEDRLVVDEKGGRCKEWTCDSPFRSCVLNGGYPWATTKMALADANSCGTEPAPDFATAKYVWEFFQTTPDLEVGAADGG